MYVCMYVFIKLHITTQSGPVYVCMVTHIARVMINRVRLPIPLLVSRTGKINISLSAFAPENLVSRDGFGSPVPHQPAHLHTQAESGAYSRDSSRIPRRRPFVYLNRHTPSGQTRIYRVTQLRIDGVQLKPVFSTCPLHTNSGYGKERRILIGPW